MGLIFDGANPVLPAAGGGGAGGVPAPSRLATDGALPAASAALAGSCAYAEDSRRTYLCRQTGAASYGWCDVASGEFTARVGPASGNGTVRGLTWSPGVAVWGQSGRTIAFGWESISVASVSIRTIVHQINDSSTRGWLIAMNTADLTLYYWDGGVGRTAVLAASLTAGPHTAAIAWVTATDLHVSVDGGAATTVTLTGSPAASGADAAGLLTHPVNSIYDGAAERVAFFRAWGSALSDATLAIVSASPSGYRPGDDGGVAVVWGWDAVRDPRDARTHTIWGSAAGSGSTAIRATVDTPTTLPWVAP
ncbi:MAG: hypothetical protein Q8S73_37855 [Deltaproteobacteria bacterium]|nr:hypothetical protein [Myxococcales bacterium]MDP3219927.1 hypothetical protein [Deltaproteobacteria bacterium]